MLKYEFGQVVLGLVGKAFAAQNELDSEKR